MTMTEISARLAKESISFKRLELYTKAHSCLQWRSWKCLAVIWSDLATPSRMATLGTTMMNLDQP